MLSRDTLVPEPFLLPQVNFVVSQGGKEEHVEVADGAQGEEWDLQVLPQGEDDHIPRGTLEGDRARVGGSTRRGQMQTRRFTDTSLQSRPQLDIPQTCFPFSF